jgi:hypothetical protein
MGAFFKRFKMAKAKQAPTTTEPELNEDGLVPGAPVDFATLQRILAGVKHDTTSATTNDSDAASDLPATAE